MKPGLARVSLLWIVILVLFALPGCQSEPPQPAPTPAPPALTPMPGSPSSPTVPDPDYWPTGTWITSTPERQGMDSAQLAAMFDDIEQQDLNLHSLLIIRNGYIVTEAYFMPNNDLVKQQVASVTKSVTGMLTGIAMGQGAFQSMSERVVSFFADRSLANLDENKGNMTLVDLLTLRAGLSCSDDAGAVMAMYQSRDWVKFTLDLPMAGAPGTQFRYCSPAVHLLSPILRVATGKDARELANEALFAPLGIAAVKPGEWDTDPQRNPEGFSGLRLTPRDMAKLGFLYLHGGNWDGKQVVPANWVAASLTPHAVEPKSGRSYGYLFWIFKEGYYGALGLGGQDIYIIPSKNIVVVFTGALEDATQVQETARLLDQYVVPAAVIEQPLAENRLAWARLQTGVSRAAWLRTPAPFAPALALAISGKVYKVDPNPAGWQTVSLSFQDKSPAATAVINGNQTLEIGLDNIYRLTGAQGSQVALRGHWEGEDTFVIENSPLGAPLQWEYRMTFPDDAVQIEVRERVNGTRDTIVGRLAR